jgi:hypothetical protein
MNEDDRDLLEQFASLRREEAASAPTFERVTGAAGRCSKHAGWGVAVAACILIAVVAAVIIHVPHPPSAAPTMTAPTLADWRAPTDFLLDTPGAALLHTIPDLGPHASTDLDSLPPIGTTTPARHAGLEHS